MSAEDKDAEEVEETTAEKKPKRRRLRSRAKEAEESSSEEKPKRARGVKGEAAADGEESEAKPKTKAKATPKATPKKAAAKAETETEAEPVAEAAVEAPEAEPKPRPAAKAEAEAPPPPARPTPAPRRAAPEPGAAPAVVRAHAKYVRTSARKARLVCDHIRGKSVDEARAILAFAPRAAARDWGKLLESAVANAEHNHELIGDDLRIKDVYADEGPTLKRYRPRAMGRATRIRKRTSHLTITLTPKENA